MRAPSGITTLPASLFLDTTLTATDLRLAAWIGSQNNNLRWTLVNQQELAAQLGKSRQTVNAGLLRLERGGWITVRRRDGFRSQLEYRVRLDTDDCDAARAVSSSVADASHTSIDASHTSNDACDTSNDASHTSIVTASHTSNDASHTSNDASHTSNDASHTSIAYKESLRDKYLYSDSDSALPQARDALLAAAGPGLADPSKSQNLFLTSAVIGQWLKLGASVEDDLVPLIRLRTAEPRPHPIDSWKYFDQAVREHLQVKFTDPEPLSPLRTPTISGGQHETRRTGAGRRTSQRATNRQTIAGVFAELRERCDD